MLKSKSSQKGFTIVELLIVIVVIGILAALVLNTFSGVQKRARDTQRQNSVNTLSTQLEAYYTNYGSYPTLGNLETPGWVSGNLKGFDAKALIAPGRSELETDSLQGTATTSKDVFGYVALPASCAAVTDNSANAVSPAPSNPCTSFTLTWWSEDKGVANSKSSLNN